MAFLLLALNLRLLARPFGHHRKSACASWHFQTCADLRFGLARPQGAVTQRKFFSNLQRNAVARQVADKIARVTPPSQHVSHRKIALRAAGKVY